MGDSAVERFRDDIRRLASDCLTVERWLAGDHASTGLQQPGLTSKLPTGPNAASEIPCSHESIADLFPGAERIHELACELRRTCERIVETVPSNTGTISQRAQRHPTVLVVDDIDDTRDLLSLILQRAGLTVITAPNGLEALVAAHSIRPSLILMDIQMPILNGIEATRLLKAMAATRHIPVVAHTSQPASCHVPPGVLFAHILPKPVIPDVLLALTQRFIPDLNGAA
jgi:CheY-like chemotaxis protein